MFQIIKTAETSLEVEQCRRVINRAFQESQRVARKDREAIPIEKSNGELSQNNKKVFLLNNKDSSSLIGTVVLTYDQQKFLADIRYFAVESTYRGNGLGTQLIRHCETKPESCIG